MKKIVDFKSIENPKPDESLFVGMLCLSGEKLTKAVIHSKAKTHLNTNGSYYSPLNMEESWKKKDGFRGKIVL